MKRPNVLLESFLFIPSLLYALIMAIRNAAYDGGLLSVYKIGRPVLSIGNLTAGGTGKTPITAYLMKEFVSRGRRVGVISRGYGGNVTTPEKVISDGTRVSSIHFGDEPAWLASLNPQISVFVGRDKVAAGRALIESDSATQLILADDAFQHRRLYRDIDVVIIDVTEPIWHDRALPLGRLREGHGSLRRASAVILSKTNLAAPLRLEAIRKKLDAYRALTPFDVFEFESVITDFFSLKGSESFSGSRLLLVSGIGRPETFPILVQNASGAEVIDHLVYPDHHRYSSADLHEIERRAIEKNVEAIVVTEKDAIKMDGWAPKVPCFVSRLSVRPVAGTKMEDWIEAVCRLCI